MLTSGINGTLRLLKLFQLTPLKNGCFLISSAPLYPILLSTSVINFLIKSMDSFDIFVSFGISRCCFHDNIFLHVSAAFSEKNGGYPIYTLKLNFTSISNIITPNDHQSTSGPYPFCSNTSGAM